MKKTMAIVLTIVTIFAAGGILNSKSRVEASEFNLIDYLETHKVESYDEFEDLISTVSPDSIDTHPINSVTDFKINIDYDNQLVYVDLIVKPVVLASGVTNTASRNYYSSVGKKIFQISITGRFTYSSGSCSTTSASGSFSPATLSTWNSTPTISTGNTSSSVAYARISGTARSGANSINYSLTLYCNDNGHTYT